MTQVNSENKKLQFIDAHHHFWDLEKNDYPWLKGHEEPNFFLGNYDAIKRNYLYKDYLQDSKDFEVLAEKNGLQVTRAFGLQDGQRVDVWPNLMAGTAVFKFERS